jgi:DNA-binding NtrC family response regulator
MNEILLCSHNPILIKSIYGMLRDEGYIVEVADHPALAVQMALNWNYTAVIIDSEPFGLSSDDAVQIIKSVSPDMPVIVVGQARPANDVLSIRMPVDLEEFRQAIHDMHQYQNIKGVCL